MSKPVYRPYSPNTAEHRYTFIAKERDNPKSDV